MSNIRKSNLEALKQAYENNKRGGNFKFWKPIKYGKYVVRFLPPSEPSGLFFKEVAQHRIGDNYYFCPKAENDPCPICEFYKKLYEKGTDDAVALAKDIKPRKQYLYNIIVKEELGENTDDSTRVYVYSSGKILYDTLMDYFFDDDYGDLTDVEKGYDFTIVKEQGDLGWPTYKKSKPKRNPSPLADDDATIEKILGNIKSLDNEVDYKSYDELKESLDRFLNTEKDYETAVNAAISTPSASKPAAAAAVKEDDDDDEDLQAFQNELLAGLDDDD